MQRSLTGLWQVSPLTDLSIPQDDITFPAALSSVLPQSLSEEQISQSEWHLMHFSDVDSAMLSCSSVDLVLSGVSHFAEVRVNGVAVFDCTDRNERYRKDIKPYLQEGGNRFEILFLEQDDDWLLDDEEFDTQPELCLLDMPNKAKDWLQSDEMGVWGESYLQFIRHVRLEQITTEQIWHHSGCELKVDLYYQTLSAGLVSASVKFDGRTYMVPIDVRQNHTSVLFQVDAPRYWNPEHPQDNDLYLIEVELDGQKHHIQIGLSESQCAAHFPL